MAWTNFPPATGLDIQAYAWQRQLRAACRERAKAKGDLAWPPCVLFWGYGTVMSLTNNGDGTYTVGVSDPNFPSGYATNRYAGFTPPPLEPWIPTDYDFVFEDDDETKVVRSSITANTAFTVTINDDFADYLTSKFLPSVSSLVGKTFRIIMRGGLFWSERWLPWPNDREYYKGSALQAGARQPISSLTSNGTAATATVTGHQFVTGDSVTISGATSDNGHYNGTFTITVINGNTFRYTLSGADSSPAGGKPVATEPHVGAYDPNARMPSHAFASGYELMVVGSDGSLKRLTVTDNTSDSIIYSRQTYTVGGNYGVILAGKKWRDRSAIKGGQPFWWYGGMTESYYTHEPDDSVAATQMPLASFTFPDPDPATGDCTGGKNVDTFDLDVFSDVGDARGGIVSGKCNGYDHWFAPDFYKSLRSLQVYIESLAAGDPVGYVEKKTYEAAATIPTLVPATLFKAVGINAFTTSTTTVTGGGTGIGMGAVALPYTPINVYYAILDATGTPQKWGVTSANTTTHLTGSFTSPDDEGKTLVLSLGWTRDHPERFLYLYDKTAFLPAFDFSGGGGSAVIYDPPTLANPGVWTTRPKSTHYVEPDTFGFVRDSNGTRPFVVGTFARYEGDNWNDPGLHTPTSEEPTDSASPIVAYEDKFFEGRRSPSHQAAINAQLSGTATGGTTSQLQDTSQSWWAGVMRAESGTADGGSTTTLSDSSKSGNAFWNAATGRWAGFVVEVTIAGIVYRRPIISMSGTTLTLTEALPASASGKAYQIREPQYELNRFKGRTVTITKPDGTQVKDIPVLNSDDNTLYFAAQSFTITAGMKYEITEYTPGGVWGRDAGNTKWIAPAGHDSRGADWHVNQTENLPTRRRDYGRLMKGDYISIGVFTELWQALNGLEWVKGAFDWTANGELNQDDVGIGTSQGTDTAGARDGFTDSGGTFHDGAKQLWTIDESNNATHTPPGDGIPDNASIVDGAPYCYAASDNGFHGCFSYGMGRRYAYGVATKIPQFSTDGEAAVKCSIDYFVYAKCRGGTDPQGCPTKETFNAQGDGVLLDEFHLFSTKANVTTATQMSDVLGKHGTGIADSANWPSDIGASGTDGCTWEDGYLATDWTCIRKYNVVGGFVYQ